jgi:hypothetical protein
VEVRFLLFYYIIAFDWVENYFGAKKDNSAAGEKIPDNPNPNPKPDPPKRPNPKPKKNSGFAQCYISLD